MPTTITNKEKNKHPHEPESFYALILETIRRAIPTLLSYDVSIGLPILGIMMTRLNEEESAPAITTLLNILVYLNFSCILPSSFKLSNLFGELAAEEKLLTELAEEPSQENDAEQKIVTLKIEQLKSAIERVPKNAIVSGLPYAPGISAMIFAKPLLSGLGQNKKIAQSAHDFFEFYWPLFLTFTPRLAMEFVLLSSKKQKSAMLMANAALLISVGLEYGLAFKTPLALKGLGLGSGINITLTSLFFSAYVAKTFKNFHFFKSFFSWNASDLKEIIGLIKMGGPIILTIVSDIATAFAISIMAGLLEKEALKIQNIAVQYLYFNGLITGSVSQTACMMVSEKRGKAKVDGTYDSVKHAVRAGVTTNMLLQLPLALFMVISPRTFGRWIGSSVENDILMHNFLLTTAVYALVDGVRYNVLQTTRALGDNAKPSIFSALFLWMGVALSYVLSQHSKLKELGLPIGLLMGSLMGTIFLISRSSHSLTRARQLDQKESNAINIGDSVGATLFGKSKLDHSNSNTSENSSRYSETSENSSVVSI